MFRKFVVAIIGLGVVGGVLAFGTPAPAQSVKAGIMTCNVAGGFGFIFGSSRTAPLLPMASLRNIMLAQLTNSGSISDTWRAQ